MAAVETVTIEPDEAGMRLDRWFKAHYPDLSFTHLQKLLRSGQVRVDGGRVKSSTRLEPGQAVRVPPLVRDSAPAETGDNDVSLSSETGEEDRPKGRGGAAARTGKAAGTQKGKRLSDADFLRSIILHEDD